MAETRELGQFGAQLSLSDRASNHPVTPKDAAVPNDASARTPVTQATAGTRRPGEAAGARTKSSPGEGRSWPSRAPTAGVAGIGDVGVSSAFGEPALCGASDRGSGSAALERSRSSRSPLARSDERIASFGPGSGLGPDRAASIAAGGGWRFSFESHSSQSCRTRAGQLESPQTSNCSFVSRRRPAFIDFCADSCESTQATLSKARAVAGAPQTASTTTPGAMTNDRRNRAMPCWPSGNL